MIDSQDQPPPSLKLLAYLRLFRLPNLFTAIADVTMGFLLVQRSLEPISAYLCLLAASCLLYTSGMVLNDVFDIDRDREHRPERPLPSGQISLAKANFLGHAMLVLGVTLATVAGYVETEATAIVWRSGAVAILLAGSILLYNAILKTTPLGPLAMGACRFFNVLLGMSVASEASNLSGWTLGYDSAQLLIAGGIGVYIVGVTWFARQEAERSNPIPLMAATVVMMGGMVMLGWYIWFVSPLERGLTKEMYWLLLFVNSFTIARRCFSAVLDPQPARVQAAVKHCILSLIFLDATLCLSIHMMHNPIYALGVLALLIPTLLLGKWVYST